MVKHIALAATACVALGASLVWSPRDSNAQGSAQTPSTPGQQSTTLGVTEVSAQPGSSYTKLGGYVEPRSTVRLSANGFGRVVYIAGEEGDRVKEGQVVVGLNEDKLQADYKEAWANLSAQMSAMQNAEVQLWDRLYGPPEPTMGGPLYDSYERTLTPFMNSMPFFGSNTVPQSREKYRFPNRAQARADYEQQQAQTLATQTRVDAIEALIRERRSIAPFSGVITVKHVSVGDVVQPGQALVELVDAESLDLRLEVPTGLVPLLEQGMPVEVELGNQHRTTATVSQIFPTANPVQRTVTVKLSLPKDAPAAPGMYASAILPGAPGQSQDTVSVPQSAVVYHGSLPSVFTVKPDGKVELRVVRLGEKIGDRISVLSGIRQGDRVVTAPPLTMRSGDSLFGSKAAK